MKRKHGGGCAAAGDSLHKVDFRESSKGWGDFGRSYVPSERHIEQVKGL